MQLKTADERMKRGKDEKKFDACDPTTSFASAISSSLYTMTLVSDQEQCNPKIVTENGGKGLFECVILAPNLLHLFSPPLHPFESPSFIHTPHTLSL